MVDVVVVEVEVGVVRVVVVGRPMPVTLHFDWAM